MTAHPTVATSTAVPTAVDWWSCGSRNMPFESSARR